MLYLLLAAIIVAADQAVKSWAVANLQGRGAVDFIPGLINFYYAENTGAAFSMLRNMRWLFIGVSIIASIAIMYVILARKVKSPWGLIPLSMVLGGAVGNLIDRIFAGYVVDMFEFSFVRFAIFNVADMFVTVGGVIFCVYYVFTETRSIAKKSGELPPAPGTDVNEN